LLSLHFDARKQPSLKNTKVYQNGHLLCKRASDKFLGKKNVHFSKFLRSFFTLGRWVALCSHLRSSHLDATSETALIRETLTRTESSVSNDISCLLNDSDLSRLKFPYQKEKNVIHPKLGDFLPYFSKRAVPK